MKALKIASILLMAGILVLVCCGCAQSFTYTEYTDANGGVHREFLLTYDLNSDDAETVRDEAVIVMRRYVETRSLEDYATIDASVDGKVAFELFFPSQTEYLTKMTGYTGREENEPANPTEVGFINTYEVTRGNYLTEANVDFVRALTDEGLKDFPLEDCTFYYVFGTTSTRVTSNGSVSESDGIYYHTWTIEPGKEANIKLYTKGVNGIILYSVVIAVFVLSLVAIFVILYIKKKKKKQQPISFNDEHRSVGGEEPPSENN